MKLVPEQFAFLCDAAKLIEYVVNTNDGMMITGGRLYSTPEEQLAYFNKKLSKTKNGNHPRKLAIDLDFHQAGVVLSLLKPGKAKKALQKYGDYWESLNPLNRWGGNFSKWFPNSDFIDVRHFERNV